MSSCISKSGISGNRTIARTRHPAIPRNQSTCSPSHRSLDLMTTSRSRKPGRSSSRTPGAASSRPRCRSRRKSQHVPSHCQRIWGGFRFKALDVSSHQLRDLAVRFGRRHVVLASALATTLPAQPEPLAAALPPPTCRASCCLAARRRATGRFGAPAALLSPLTRR